MHYLGFGTLAILIMLFMAGQSQTVNGNADSAVHAKTPRPATLQMSDGEMIVRQAGCDPLFLGQTKAHPYSIISATPPYVATTCNELLEVTTIVAGNTPFSFTNMLPILVKAPYCVLAELALSETALNGKAVLVDAEGKEIWSTPEGLFLHHSTGKMPEHTLLFADTPGASHFAPMGAEAELVLVNWQSGEELWRTTWQKSPHPIDVTLLAADSGYGLLAEQFGYVSYGFSVIDLANGEVLRSWQLTGQPSTQMVFPGGFSQLTQLGLDDHVVELLVVNNAESFEVWNFDLMLLTMEKTVVDTPQFYLEENELLHGGAGTPAPANPPFPQEVLPTAHGNDWSIPALVNGMNQVLIVGDENAYWLGYNDGIEKQ